MHRLRNWARDGLLHVTNSRIESSDYPESGAFPDAVSRAVDNERRDQYRSEGQHFENDYVLTLTYLPPVLLKGKMRNFLFEADAGEEKGATAIGRKGDRLLHSDVRQYRERVVDRFGEGSQRWRRPGQGGRRAGRKSILMIRCHSCCGVRLGSASGCGCRFGDRRSDWM